MMITMIIIFIDTIHCEGGDFFLKKSRIPFSQVKRSCRNVLTIYKGRCSVDMKLLEALYLPKLKCL